MARHGKTCQNLYPGLVLHASPPHTRGIPCYAWAEMTRNATDMLMQRWSMSARSGTAATTLVSVRDARQWFDANDDTNDLVAAVLLCIDTTDYSQQGDSYTLSVIECNQYYPASRSDTTLDFGRDPIADLLAANLPALLLADVPL